MSGIILCGVVLMQVEHASSLGIRETVLCVVPVLIAAFAYPLGNRKMMQVCKGELDVFQRVLGMTLASLPFWFYYLVMKYQQADYRQVVKFFNVLL